MDKIDVGASVYLTKLRKSGVVSAVLSGGRLRVIVGSLTVTCGREEVRVTPPSRKKAAPQLPETPIRIKKPPGPAPAATLDLHGFTAEQAIRKLELWINRVILSDLSHVKVIHGLGSGTVRQAVHSTLATISAVRRFNLNERNLGETDIYL